MEIEITFKNLQKIGYGLIQNKHGGIVERGLVLLADANGHRPSDTAIGRTMANFLNRLQPGAYTEETDVASLFPQQRRTGGSFDGDDVPMLDYRLSDKWFDDIPGLPEPWFVDDDRDTDLLHVIIIILASDTSTEELRGLFASLNALHSDGTPLISEGSAVIQELFAKTHDFLTPEGFELPGPVNMNACNALIANVRTLVDAMERLKAKLDDDGWKPNTGDARMMTMIASQYSHMAFHEPQDGPVALTDITDCLDSRCLDLMQTAVGTHDDSMLAATLAFRKIARILIGIRQENKPYSFYESPFGDDDLMHDINLFHDNDEHIMNAMRAMLDDVHMPEELMMQHASAMLDE